jgi:membrane protease YdiL (CAAX protease family)
MQDAGAGNKASSIFACRPKPASRILLSISPMPQLPPDPLLNWFTGATMLLSIGVGLYVLSLRQAGPILRYEPRRPVPWGPAGCILAGLYLLLALSSSAAESGPQTPLDLLTAVAIIAQQFVLVGGFVVVIALISKARWCDLGFPQNANQLSRDVFIGAVACLAALAPVHLTQIVLLHLLFPGQEMSGNPLIKMATSGPPSVTVMVLTGLMAVVVAPICEEITFRLLLQGWLEKWEDKRLNWRTEPAATPMVNDEGEHSEQSSLDIRHSSSDSSPPQQGIAGLPYGWFPILISALLFGIAHFGYGPEPVSIYLLGLVLGYVYQRTHRILPSIVTHALFNLFSMVVLWRMMFYAH